MGTFFVLSRGTALSTYRTTTTRAHLYSHCLSSNVFSTTVLHNNFSILVGHFNSEAKTTSGHFDATSWFPGAYWYVTHAY